MEVNLLVSGDAQEDDEEESDEELAGGLFRVAKRTTLNKSKVPLKDRVCSRHTFYLN